LILPDLQTVQRRRKRVLGFVSVVMLFAVLTIGSAWPQSSWPRVAVESIGLLLILAAIVGRAWCSLYIGGRKKSELVQEGPYSLCRNPLYVFSVMGVFGALSQTGSISLAAAFTAVTAAVFIPVVRQEEAYLSAAFPGDYDDYARRTPRFLPAPALWRTSSELTVRPKFLVRTLLDGLPFLAAWPAFELLSALHDGPLKPLLRLP
jgi:protein-S-isoprenylcysteine O-methyltransferase Ste14